MTPTETEKLVARLRSPSGIGEPYDHSAMADAATALSDQAKEIERLKEEIEDWEDVAKELTGNLEVFSLSLYADIKAKFMQAESVAADLRTALAKADEAIAFTHSRSPHGRSLMKCICESCERHRASRHPSTGEGT